MFIQVPLGGAHCRTGSGQLLPEDFHLLTDGIAQRFKSRLSFFRTLNRLSSRVFDSPERIASLSLALALCHLFGVSRVPFACG